MIRVPIVSDKPLVIETLRSTARSLQDELQLVFFSDKEVIIEYLKYELPEMKIIDCTSGTDNGIDGLEILDAIRDDPWLHYGGVVAIHDNDDEKQLQKSLKDTNIIAVLHMKDFKANISRLLRILVRNKHFLFQRAMQQHLIRTISGTFIIDNDPLDIVTYTNLVTNYLFNANLLNRDDREKLHVALQELLVNAIEHGNCKISYEEKTAWLEAGNYAMDLIREKNKHIDISARKVLLSYTISTESSSFSIKDEGSGFDWKARLAAKPELGLHGMGIQMATVYVNELSYNDSGNEVSFKIQHQKDSSNVVPLIFSDQSAIRVKPHEIVVKEGDTSDYLYYIVSGRFMVFSGNKYVSYLTPDDMFIGEMSFLLSNQRTATVVSKDGGTLIKVSKEAFVDLIKKNPHYGIFLARLLAQRLTRLNSRSAKLNAECLRLRSIVEGTEKKTATK
ncbi:cyclic nucleotide-binding domain-containing protein [Treponema sp.]